MERSEIPACGIAIMLGLRFASFQPTDLGEIAMKLKAIVAMTSIAIAGCQQSEEVTSSPIPIASAATNASASDLQAGRYQLFQGWYRFVNLKGEEHRTETLFKIDTATGEIFECSSVQFVQDGKGVQKTACLPFENDLPLGSIKE
jgi:hypothetical protein